MGTTRPNGYVQKDNGMLITLTRYYSKNKVLVNPLHIISAEGSDDEVLITLTSSKDQLRVLETLDEISKLVSALFK